jgi:NAD(P)-dependent dehydrogenase (short-subunit alcohol dehydrogenase family)
MMARPVMMIAGAGPGMGRAVAVMAAQRGYDLTLIARRAPILEETATLVRNAGGAALCLPADVTDPGNVTQLMASHLAHFGRLDVLVHSILPPHLFKRILDLTPDDLEAWRKSAEVSTFGALLMAHAAARPMAAAGHGSMVFGTATSGLQSYPAVSAHAAGKAAIHALMQSLASELGPLGIRANAMAVGVIDGATARAPMPALPPQMAADVHRAVDASAGALRRNITEAEAAEAIMFLASEASSGITGQILAVDGGRIFH